MRAPFLLLALSFGVAQARGRVDERVEEHPDPYAAEWLRFKTEPSFRANRIVVTHITDERSRLAPGLIFIAPFAKPGSPLLGPQIRDQHGDVVWYGNASTRTQAQNFFVCDYEGGLQNHLCWSENFFTHKPLNRIRGIQRILDSAYQPADRAFGAADPLQYPNAHEFNVMPGGETFLQVVYEWQRLYLKDLGGPERGWIEDGCFQEIEMRSGEALFSWCGSDHSSFSEASFLPSDNTEDSETAIMGDGSLERPWDWYHINAVDKDDGGSYYVSARNLNQILKVAGPNNTLGIEPGEVIWRLGGKENEFSNYDEVDLSRQHHVRHLSTSGNATVLSIFNNQCEAAAGTRHASNGQIVRIDTGSKKVLHVKKLYSPEDLISYAQGSIQLLPNQNYLVGWGGVAHLTEFASDGEVLFHAHINRHVPGAGPEVNQINYRAFKFPWVGRPRSDPKLVPYSQLCRTDDTSPFVAYVSWNGATEVTSWRFTVSPVSRRGPWYPAGTFQKIGFETKVALQNAWGGPAKFARYVSVEALDAHGSVLGSTIADTFVPRPEIGENCSAEGCDEPWFEYDSSRSRAGSCPSSTSAYLLPPLAVVAVVCIVVFCVFQVFKWIRVHRRRGVTPDDATWKRMALSS